MKKTLSVVLTSAMAFSMFSAVAFGKTSADFTDLKDLDAATQAKFDAMISANIFDGVSDTTFGLKDEMNRAQFAKVAALIMGLDVNKDLQTSSFSDVSVSDAANGYALPYIEALKTANVTDGFAEGQYNPAGKVTKEQLATFLVRVLGKDAEAKTLAGTDTTVSGWAQGYVTEALALKLLSNNTDGTFGGMVNATRDLLVTGSYEAKQQYVPAGKVSVTEAKATGVYKATVTFNKPVDTTKAVVSLTKGTLAVTGTTTWSDDKKVATLTTDTKIGEGDYTATVSGLDADTVGTATATFTAKDEEVSKIDFVNASDTVAYSTNAVIKLKAQNQYGEAVSMGTSSFTALVSGQAPASFKKDDDGNLVITANVTTNTSQGNGIIPVTVYFNNSNITVSKNFKVGTVPILSKIETGTVTYSNGGTKLVEVGDTASIALNLFDQYGNPIVRGQFDNNEIAASNINPVITPYDQNLEIAKVGPSIASSDFFDENDNTRVQVKLTGKEDKVADFTVNIYGGASSATATVSVGAANLATKIEFDTSAVSLAASDADVYVPLVVTDANGNKLSAQDIVDNYNDNRFNFSVTNGTWSIQPTGDDKGKLKLHFPSGNTVGNKVYVTGQISQSQSNTFVQTSIPVQDARVAERITVATEPAAKAILGAGDDVVYQLKDQYGSDISNIGANIPSANGQTSNYRVKVEVTTDGAGTTAVPKLAHAPTVITGAPANVTTYYYDNTQFADFNKGFNFTSTPGSQGKVTVKAVVEKATNGTNFSEYSSAVSRTFEAIKSDTALTYSIDTLGSLYAAQDNLTSGFAVGDTVTANDSHLRKELAVIAKDSAGNKVILPHNYVQGISSSDPSVITTANVGTDGYVIGNKAGTATVSAVVYTNNGETINLTQAVTVKADAISVDKLTAGAKSATLDSRTFAYEYFTDGDDKLAVTDNYGIEYDNADIAKYDAILGLRYTVSVVSGSGTVQVDAKTGEITMPIDSNVQEFLITAIAPNGKSVQVSVAR